jgi:hypothetical protein
MAHLLAMIVAVPFLGSCSGGNVVADRTPEWLGGMPKGVPPRPGTPEYDAFTKKQEAEANRDKSKDPPKQGHKGHLESEAQKTGRLSVKPMALQVVPHRHGHAPPSTEKIIEPLRQ